MNLTSALGLARRKFFAKAAVTPPSHKRTPRLVVQQLEERAVPATLPAPEVSSYGSVGSGYAPAIVQSQATPSKLVMVSTTGANITIQYSNNGGAGWQTAIHPIHSTWINGIDAKASNPDNSSWVRYTNVGQPSVAFDRFEHFYVANVERNADGTAGRIVVRKFDFTGNIPQLLDLDPNDNYDAQPNTVGNEDMQVLYKWYDGDEAYNVNIAVNSNMPSTDPRTTDPIVQGPGGTFTDPFANTQTSSDNTALTPITNDPSISVTNNVKVFVTWNTRDVYGATHPANVRQSVSNNGGFRFGAPVMINDSGTVPLNSTSPEVVFTPGRTGQANSGGSMITTFTTAGGVVYSDVVDFDGTTNTPLVVEGLNNQNSGITDALPAPSGQTNHIPQTTYYDVDIPTGSGITSIDTLTLGLALYHNNLSEIKVELIKRDNNNDVNDTVIGPGNVIPDTNVLQSITLIENRTDSAGNTRGGTPGIAGTTLGRVKRNNVSRSGIDVGTWFNDLATHNIRNGSGTFSGVFVPEVTSYNGNVTLSSVFGQLAADQIDSGGKTGKWQLRITDFRNSGTLDPTPQISMARLQINQNFDHRRSGDTIAAGANAGSATGNTYGTGSGAVPAGAGIGPHVSMAVDTSLGAFSPYQNRVYMAYNAGGSVNVKYSDDGGNSWQGTTTVGAGFNPAITVDPATGTVIVTYYSTIYDPAGVRAVTMMATSVNQSAFNVPNGTMEFSAPSPINPRESTYDQIRTKILDVEATPSNGPQLGTGADAYGNSMGLAAFNGRVTSVYTGNYNAGGASLRSQRVRIATGPRIVKGDQGTVLAEAEAKTKDWVQLSPTSGQTVTNGSAGDITYNATVGPDGRQQFDGFVVEFDRPIDPATFTVDDITVIKRRPNDNNNAAPTGSQIIPATDITPLDDYRDPFTNAKTLVNSTATAIPDNGVLDSIIDTSTLLAPGTNVTATTGIQVTVNLSHANLNQLRLELISPMGTPIVLVNNGVLSGTSMVDTIFTHAAGNPNISTGSAPYTGTFRVINLSSLFGQTALGEWTLRVTDTATGQTGSLTEWGLTFNNVQTYYGAKRFLVSVPPQSDVGTYSYSIGSDINERIRGGVLTTINPTLRNYDGIILDNNIPDNDGNNDGVLVSPLIVPVGNGAGEVPLGSVITSLSVTVNISHPDISQLDLALTAPDGRTIPLVVAGAAPGGSGATGTSFTNTRFIDSATQTIATGTAPYTGDFQVFAPATAALDNLIGSQAYTSGTFPNLETWALTIRDNVQNLTGTLDSWSIRLGTNVPTVVSVPGNKVDQDADGLENEGDDDTFAIPKPTNKTPFVLPYEVGSLPIIIPGPRLVDSRIPGQQASPDNLVIDNKVSSIDVEFDRTMSAASFTPADVLSITGPLGDIDRTGLTVTPITALGGVASLTDSKFFRITFKEQYLSGTYHIQFSSKISQSIQEPIQEGGANVSIELDTNSNAGLDNLTGAAANAAIVTRTYGGSIATPVNIAANSTTTVPLVITDAYLLQRAIAELTINHTKTRDLTIRLVSPNNVSVLLSSGAPTNGSDALGFTNTKFDDAATTSILLGAGGFANASYNPIQPLAQLNNGGSAGTWRLVVINKGTVTGTINKFQLYLDAPQTGTGLGEAVADRVPISFRIYNAAGSNPDARGNWTPVGPAQANGNSAQQNNVDSTGSNNTTGRTSTIAVDPSDPSGNTVFAGGASGGVWKTTNFLTRDPAGPTWVPLTDFGPTNAINIGSIALYNATGDPKDTVVLVGTGSEDANRIEKLSQNQVLGNNTPNEFRYDGVGFLISTNGGKDWNVLDSTDNYDPVTQKYRAVTDPARNHVFVGSTVRKVLFEKNLNAFNSLPIMYAVVGRGSAGAAAEGLWRSENGGRTWTKLFASGANQVSDFVLSEGSASSTSGNRPTTAYLGVEGLGVLRTTNLNSTNPNFITINGGQGRPTLNTGTIGTNGPTGIPNGANGRVVLAVPSFVSNDPLANAYYRNWVFAAVANTNGTFNGLYVSKDAALGTNANWTKVKLTSRVGPDGRTYGFDDNGVDVDITDPISPQGVNWGGGNHSFTLATDPNDPNILYFGSDTLMRIDVTQIIDPYNLWMYTSTNNDGGQTLGASDGSVNSGGGTGFTDPNGIVDSEGNDIHNFLNFSRLPSSPFSANTGLTVNGFTTFLNTGGNVLWSVPDTSRDGGAAGFTENNHDFDWISQIITVRDPLTGKARVLYTSDQSIRTFVSNDNGTLNEVRGFDQPGSLLNESIYTAFEEPGYIRTDNFQVEGVRNGNIQVGRIYSGETQPSLLAASITGSFLAAAAHRASDVYLAPETTISQGNDDWDSLGARDRANYVVADQTGTGNVYILRRINDMYNNTVDFFQVSFNGNAPESRTIGLFQDGNDAQGLGQWDNRVRRFAVNPINPYGVLIGSSAGRLYRTDSTSDANAFQWQEVASPAELDGSYTTAMAFGAPSPLDTDVNNHLYVGTENGRIFATATGKGGWQDISNGLPPAGANGQDILEIVPNPTRGSFSAYALTQFGVYFMADWTAPGATWVNITSNMPALTVMGFNNPDWEVPFINDQPGAISALTSIAVDWRPLTAPTPGIPVLYVSGDGGIVRSIDGGVTWDRYPMGQQNAASEGGGLPVVKVSDIDLALGNIDPNTGRTLPSGSPDMLVASTIGRGVWVLPLGKPAGVSGPKVIAATPTTPQDGTFNKVTLDFDTYIDSVSFKPSDVTITAPDGSTVQLNPIVTGDFIPDGILDVTPVVTGQPNLHNKWELNFPNQTMEGVYTITVGPGITDAGGTFMNQNGNAVNGEAGDAFVLQVVYGRNDTADFIKDAYRALLSPRDSNGVIVGAGRVPTTAEYLAASKNLERYRLTALTAEAQKLLVTDEARKEMVRRLFVIPGGAPLNEVGNLFPLVSTNNTVLQTFDPTVADFNALLDKYVLRLKTGKITPQGIMAEILASDSYIVNNGPIVGTPMTANEYLTKVYADLFKGPVGMQGANIQFSMLPTATQTSQQNLTTSFSRRLTLIRSLTNGGTVRYDHDANPATALLSNGFRQHLIRLAYDRYAGRPATTADINSVIKLMNRVGNSVAPSGIEWLYRKVLSTQEYFNLQAQKFEGAGSFPDTGLRTNRAWVEGVFEDRYTNRTPDANGFYSLATEREAVVQRILDNRYVKTYRSRFLSGLLNSAEFRTLKANEAYQMVFQRNASPEEITSYVNGLRSTTRTHETQLATLFASAAFYTEASNSTALTGTNNEKFVKLLYNRLLGRDPSATELTARLAQLSGGRYRVSLYLIQGRYTDGLATFEYRRKVVDKYYQDMLGRLPNSTEMDAALSYMSRYRLEFFLTNLIGMTRNYWEIEQ